LYLPPLVEMYDKLENKINTGAGNLDHRIQEQPQTNELDLALSILKLGNQVVQLDFLIK